MVRKLLVPLDGTPRVERGVAVASCLAGSLRPEIWLVDAMPAPLDVGKTKSAFLYLERIARHLALTAMSVGMQVRTGSSADRVLSGIALVSADLLILATSLR